MKTIRCTTATVSTIDEGGRNNSIAIGQDGFPLIVYAGFQQLKVAHCEDIKCTNADVTILDENVDALAHASVTIGSDGFGVISYGDNADNLLVAHCENIACTDATSSIVDTIRVVGGHTSIATGSDGLPLISYRAKLIGGQHSVDSVDPDLCLTFRHEK